MGSWNLDPASMTNPGVSPALAPTYAEEQGLGALLREVDDWRHEAEARLRAEVDGIDAELTRIATVREELERRERQLKARRDAIALEETALPATLAARARGTLIERLTTQARALHARGKRTAELREERERRLLATLHAQGLTRLFEEHARFETQASALDALPETYREALLAHHAAQGERLAAAREAADPGPVTLDAEPLELDVALAIDAPADGPALLSALFPVTARPPRRGQPASLDLHVALRVVEGLYSALLPFAPDARVVQGTHEGLVAIEIELPAAPPDAWWSRLLPGLAALWSEADDLAAARVVLRTVTLPASLLLPGDEPTAEVTHA
jgi:hypothetical protein